MLGDLRVLDLSGEFGLMCGQLLADMGADVQQWVRPASAARLHDSWHWRAYTLGKGVRIVDWPAEPVRLRDALAAADVLIESEPAGALAALGLDRATIERINPRLIHVSITGFGSDGPKADYAYSDLTVAAASGYLYVTGSATQAPLRISAPQAHGHASADAAVAVLIALAERERSGLGQHVDAAGQQSFTLALLSRALDGSVGQPKAERSAYGAQMGAVYVRNQFDASDGPVVVLQGVLPPLAAFMERLMAWVLEEGLCGEADTRWPWGQCAVLLMTGQITAEQWAPVQDGIAALVGARTKAELMRAAVERRLLIAPVLSVGDVLDSEHLIARNAVAHTPEGRRLGPFARFAGSPLPLRAGQPGDWAGAGDDRAALPERHGAAIPAASAAAAGPAIPESTVVAPAPSGFGFTPAPGAGPLAGLKVLDLFWIVAGPGATRMLADYGATVVHVESTQRLDMVRNVPPYIEGAMEPERAACHHSTNCNKLNITLDLASDDGRAVLADLIRWADVLTESFAPGVLARMGFDYPAVRALNPEIIMISSCLMGQDGPWSAYAGYGNLAAAVSGFHALTGHPGHPPTGCFGPYTDFTSVRFNALAILAALRHRAATGEGQFIDMAQVEAALQFLAPDCLAYLRDGVIGEPCGNRDPDHAPSGVYPVAGENRWIAISVTTDAQWRALCDLAAADFAGAGLADGPDFTDSSDSADPADSADHAVFSDPAVFADAGLEHADARRRAHDRIDAALAAWTGTQDGVALERRLQALAIPAHRVLDTHELATDPQLVHRGHFIGVRHPQFAPAAVESSRLKLSRNPPRQPEAAPHFGADNEHVLARILGYDAARIDALRDVLR